MVRPNTILCCEDKRHVTVVARLINLVHQRWSNAVLTLPIDAVAGRAGRTIGTLADLLLLGETWGQPDSCKRTCGKCHSFVRLSTRLGVGRLQDVPSCRSREWAKLGGYAAALW